jgi:carbonic anhydrase
MFEIIYRYDPSRPLATSRPATPVEAKEWLESGNDAFAHLSAQDLEDSASRSWLLPLDPRDLGLGGGGQALTQEPFAAVLGCADARVPLETIFQRGMNDIFAVRVAGNVLGAECLGSMEYAAGHLHSLKLAVVVGHSGCGAVTATVDAFLKPGDYTQIVATQSLRAIIDKLFVMVRGAATSLAGVHGDGVVQRPGYRAALIDLAIALNAMVTASMLQRELEVDYDELGVAWGMYDLRSRRVGAWLARPEGQEDELTGLLPPPHGVEHTRAMAVRLASSRRIQALLDGQEDGR